MNTIMRKAQKAILSLSIAILTAAGIVTVAAFAGGPYLRTEGTNTSQNLWRFSGTQTKQTLTSASCAGGYCGTLTQPTGGAVDTYYAWNMGTSNVNNIYYWCAYIPTTLPTAAVRYDVWEKSTTYYWYVLVNQANHKGKNVYLGFSDHPNINDASKYPVLRNQCLSGYACDGRKIYFDTIKYTTYPTVLNSSCQ